MTFDEIILLRYKNAKQGYLHRFDRQRVIRS